MADYFEEMGWQPLSDGEAPDGLLHLARLLRDFGMFDVLGEDKKLPPPAAKEAVENLAERKCTDADEKCAVCLKEYTVGDIVKILPCKHDFHPACILPWLEKTNSCPVCRYEMPTDDENYEQYRKEKLRAKQREADIENLHNSMFS
ncbi:E3 ubiquitin-protein ligase RNF181 isoform X3 [Nilaparvata lugens]|uniref:E3 ubiquitin-protein ligase RNF181 isoform X3 n=1 Tax=Nilaparvata lugens TaxID=108931 RepID=UPI00193CB12F|nr:E3 ubiquitin-protein ligase RNF181 isoform X3 [Nilaparvata lugens]